MCKCTHWVQIPFNKMEKCKKCKSVKTFDGCPQQKCNLPDDQNTHKCLYSEIYTIKYSELTSHLRLGFLGTETEKFK